MTLIDHRSSRRGGIDRRTVSARRIANLVETYTAALGGPAAVDDLQREAVLKAAQPGNTPVGVSAQEVAAAEFCPDPYVLRKLPVIINGSPATREIVEAAWFTGFAADDDPPTVVAGLEKLLEMQRHSLYSDRIHWVGGWGQLTVITPEGIEQRVLQRWEEDRIGELIQPLPIDWRAWNASRERPAADIVAAAGVDLDGLSRLQRERMLKKAKKGTLRAVT